MKYSDIIQKLFEYNDPSKNPKLMAWFAGSKVVDGAGNPLPVFHGTQHQFDRFSSEHIGKRDSGFFGTGFYFTPDYNAAEEYAYSHKDNGGRILEVYLSVKNPFFWDMSSEKSFNNLKKYLDNIGVDTSYAKDYSDWHTFNLGTNKDRQIFDKSIKQSGHDGVIVLVPDYETNAPIISEVVVFSPNQIKSVFAKDFKDSENISERREEVFIPDFNKDIIVYKNPSFNEVMGILKRQNRTYPWTRGYVEGNDYYIWNADDAIHGQVAKALGFDYNYENRCDIMVKQENGEPQFDCEFFEKFENLPLIKHINNKLIELSDEYFEWKK